MKRGVLVFVMKGCGACHEYMPRFKRLAAPYHARGLPVGVFDVTTPKGARLANAYKVKATPTTVAVAGDNTHVRVGAVDDRAIAGLLAKVAG